MNLEDEVILEGEQENDETTKVEKEEDEQDDDEASYRGKLNATNRFLQSQGYKFENGKWNKPAETVKEVPQKTVSADITAIDTLAFIDAGVTNSEDIAEVMKLAKGFDMSITDALKDPTVKHRLNVLKEQRATANASNTRTARSGAKGIDAKELVNNLSKGEVPKSGSNEAEELYWARRGGRR